MKKLLSAAIFILFTTAVFAQATNCKQFRTGTFTYITKFNGQKVIVKRSQTLQLEY
jgi:hypothetical protein